MSKPADYQDFLASKFDKIEDAGFKIEREELNPVLHEWQKDIVAWGLRKGRCAFFTDTGTGKTPMQIEWARLVQAKTAGKILILTPLAVAEQTIAMADKLLGVKVVFAMTGDICKEPGIYITNYEKLHHFDPAEFSGIVLDESSILKHEDSATRKLITDSFAETPYKLACTATPAPNDYMELGNHSEFLGILTMSEMLASYFVHDGGETQKWRLKGHAENIFWKWLGKWAICLRRPSDLGYSDKGYKLPALIVHKHIVKTESGEALPGFLMALPAITLQERQGARRNSIEERVKFAAEMIRAKFAACRHQKNTSGNTIKKTESNDSPNAKPTNNPIERRKRNTTLHISKPIETNGIGIENSKTPSTPERESDIKQTHHTGKKPKLSSKDGSKTTQKKDTLSGPENTDSPQKNMPKCLNGKTEDAPSAKITAQEDGVEIKNSTSIIAIPQEKCAGSSAQTAISESENSEMILCECKEQWLIWCKLNAESEAITDALKIQGSVELTGTQPSSLKAAIMMGFANREERILVSKASICGHGMNWQTCHNIIFIGMDDSYESYYQAIRRCWRYGQKKPVHVHLVISDMEEAVLRNIEKKEAAAQAMMSKMIAGMSEITLAEIKGTTKQRELYMTKSETGENFTMHLGDNVEVMKGMASDSIHYSIKSIPFASLYTYSATERDMGNCSSDGEFWEHFDYFVPEMFRVMMPGRLVSIHCMNLPTQKSREGYIGIRDFRGDVIRAYQKHGFIYHSEVCIWKDPLVAMQRTKARGLLHGALVKDSAISRQGIPDYLVTMRKPGDNPEPITHGAGFDRFIGDPQFEPNDPKGTNPQTNKYGHYVWQRYASPVWMDIDPGKTLQFRSVREQADEKHICPLQLQVIERGLELWSNPGDLVLSPFAGIGSEGYCALRTGRRFVGIELAPKYYTQAVANLKRVEDEKAMDLFAERPALEPETPKPKPEKKPRAKKPAPAPAGLFA